MRRLLVLAATVLVALTPAVAPAVELPAPSSGQGINVTPDPDSTRKSDSGTLAELGTVEPGTPVRDAVVVRSSLDEPLDVHLYAADALPAVGGGFGFTGRTDAQEQVGIWLRLAQTRITLPPRGRVEVPYVVTVPSGTEGGEYVGAIVAEQISSSADSGVQSRTRFAMAVYLRVPGGARGATPGRGRPDGRLVVESVEPRFEGVRACPVVTYRNDSQDIVDPVATVRTEGLVGGSSYTRDRTGALLPDSRAEVVLPCLDRPIGPGRIEVELSSPRGGGRESSTYTWLPWPVVASLALVLLLIGATATTVVRGALRRREREASDDSADRLTD